MTAVERVARRIAWARAGRCVAVGIGAGSVVAALGGGAFAGLGALALLGLRRPDPAAAADRLDAASAADGAVRTAWDHRDNPAPMARAQRARVLGGLTPATVRAAAPPPHPAWLLGVALLAWPVVQRGAASGPDGVEPAPEAPVSVASGAPETGAPASDGEAAAPQTDAPRAAASGSAPSDAPASTASEGRGAAGAVAEVAGVGGRAGDRRARPVTAREVGLSEGTTAGLWLSDVSGTALPEPTARVALAPPAGSPGDDIIDPARPYPRRYHALIARWFDR